MLGGNEYNKKRRWGLPTSHLTPHFPSYSPPLPPKTRHPDSATLLDWLSLYAHKP